MELISTKNKIILSEFINLTKKGTKQEARWKSDQSTAIMESNNLSKVYCENLGPKTTTTITCKWAVVQNGVLTRLLGLSVPVAALVKKA